MRTSMMGMGLAILMAGCGGDGREPAAGNAIAENGIAETENQIASLSEGQRNAVFIRAIRDAAQDCQGVESSTRVGEYRGYPVWSAQCEGGRSYTIVVTADDTAQVLNDAEARLAGLNTMAPAENEQGPAEKNSQ